MRGKDANLILGLAAVGIAAGTGIVHMLRVRRDMKQMEFQWDAEDMMDEYTLNDPHVLDDFVWGNDVSP